LKINALVKPR